jgi:DNA-binding MarR family transcriptional regulator
VTELAQLAQVSKPTVVYLVNDLELLGYVERAPDPADGRAKLVRLTARGAQAQEAAREIVAQIEGDWSRLLGPSDFDTLRQLLQRLHGALCPVPASSPPPSRVAEIAHSRLLDDRWTIHMNNYRR